VDISLFKATKIHELNAHHFQHPTHHVSPQFPCSLNSKRPLLHMPGNPVPHFPQLFIYSISSPTPPHAPQPHCAETHLGI